MNEHLRELLYRAAEDEGDSMAAVALAIDRLATAVRDLGNGDAATRMGGLEALGKVMEDGMERIASAIGSRP